MLIESPCIYLGLSARVGQDLILNQAFGAMPSKENIQDIWWYRIQQDGKKELLYCNSTSCGKFTDCYSSCPEYLTRLSTVGTSLILKNVGQNDRGLEFQRRIELNMKRMAAKPMPRIETVKIKVVLGKCLLHGLETLPSLEARLIYLEYYAR